MGRTITFKTLSEEEIRSLDIVVTAWMDNPKLLSDTINGDSVEDPHQLLVQVDRGQAALRYERARRHDREFKRKRRRETLSGSGARNCFLIILGSVTTSVGYQIGAYFG